uniref:Zn(2)-C6 fungal-type domain-containing protein n=1 Tax=Ramularia collo-cygni TaxID=112498 RepID=A0A2D3V2V2_9PEZI
MSTATPGGGADATLVASLADDATAVIASRDSAEFLPRLPPSTHTPSWNELKSDEDVAEGEVPPKILVDAQGRTLNPRSCVTCRKRKVKCDKLHPCSNCSRAHIECVFPAPGRAPRKSKKAGEGRDKELLARLRRLEGVVKGLGVEVDNDASRKESEKGNEGDNTGTSKIPNGQNLPVETRSPSLDDCQINAAAAAHSNPGVDDDFAAKTQWVESQQHGRFEHRFGRLVVNEGKSRYINNSFWANLSNEVEDLKGILNQSSDEDDDASPGSQSQKPSAHHGFIFGFSSQSVDILSLHPLPSQIGEYWNVYKDRVDPLLKVLHLPTLECTVLSAASHLPNLSRGFECLLFAIYYGAATSLNSRECMVKLGEEKSVLLARYRFAVEQALARANFLTTEELVVLQAFVIFLTCLRRNNDARVIWTLTGLVVRIAQTIGIHRDGSHFDLAPFEIEMRRRLWWQVCTLDTRASEDHGCDPTIIEQSFDTKLPLNANDADWTPGMKSFPPERIGGTDMSFCLLRYDVANTFRRLNYIPPGPPKQCSQYLQSITLQDKERWITGCHQRLEDNFLKHCDMSVPLFWVTATVARLMMSKMWLIVYHPFQRQDGGATLSEEVKHKLFITSLENMEYSNLLETEERTKHWGWLFKTYIQWHALAFTLSELCHRTTGDLANRAWVAVEQTCNGRLTGNAPEDSNTGHLWRPLKKLYRKAKAARNRALRPEAQMDDSTPFSSSRSTYHPNENPMFDHSSRPAMTRAPLSSAQTDRFSNGPTFGQTPGDAHKLLRSPRPSQAGIDDLTAANDFSADNLQSSLPQDFVSTSMEFSMTPTGTTLISPHVPQQSAPFNPSYISGAGDVDFSDIQMDLTNTSAADQMLQTSPFDINDNDFSNMDTSGDVDWENWDQLVRQFGEDADGAARNPASVATTTGQYWAGPQWGTSADSSSRPGMGMDGDWF